MVHGSRKQKSHAEHGFWEGRLIVQVCRISEKRDH
jgi:hypothetical protein